MVVTMKVTIVKFHCHCVMLILIDGPDKPCKVEACYALAVAYIVWKNTYRDIVGFLAMEYYLAGRRGVFEVARTDTQLYVSSCSRQCRRDVHSSVFRSH